MAAVIEHAPALGINATCEAFDVARSTYFRKRAPVFGPRPKRPAPGRKLDVAARREVLDVLHEPR